ncbi:RND transporter [Rickettsia conorii subsp. raoultii]|nr:RND transporter [Rickettsia conorii subsp. raoultii]
MQGNCVAIDEAISGVCYYFMRLPYSLRLLAMMIFDPHNNG